MSEPASGRPKLRLITIPPSHFCEKARWALDRAGARYVEERHAPVFHMPFAAVAGRQRTLPVLVTPHGVLGQSTAILRHVDGWLAEPARLFPHDEALSAEVSALVTSFDENLAVVARRWVYSYVLPQQALFVELMDVGLPNVERALFVASAPAVRTMMTRAFRIRPDTAERTMARLRTIFDEVGSRLADGRRFLAGGRFTAADLSFAALGAVCVLPDEFGAKVPPRDRIPHTMLRAVEELRATPAGGFILRMYREHRAGLA